MSLIRISITRMMSVTRMPAMLSPTMGMMQAQHFLLARALLAAYVLVHFGMLIPYAAELLSDQGMLANASASPLSAAFPNVLNVYDTPFAATLLVALGALAAGMLLCGVLPRSSSLVAYYVWAAVFTRNPLILNPSLPYVGLMLLACAAVRCGASDSALRRCWRLLWIAMAIGYTYSGLTKLTSPSWADGSALQAVLQSPLARPTMLRAWLLTLPPALLCLAAWGTLALEVSFAPLSLLARARPRLWGAMLALHFSLLALVQFADLTVGMLLLHVLTFDVRWLKNVSPAASALRVDHPEASAGLARGWRALHVLQDEGGSRSDR